MRNLQSLRLLLADKDKEIEELNEEIEELNESITWWSNRFNALQRDNSTLMEEIEQLKKELTEEKNAYIKMYNMYVEKDNIINGMEKFFQYAYDNEVKPLNNRKVSVWTICLDKLQELKGSDKE